jgi:hypothetical protein
VGKQNLPHPIAGPNQHCFLNKFDRFKMRAKQLKIRSRQSRQ